MEDLPKIIDAVINLIHTLVTLLGVRWTLFFSFAIPIGTFLWKKYNNNRKDAVFNLLIKEKDDTIARMREEVKVYRVHFFKESVLF